MHKKQQRQLLWAGLIVGVIAIIAALTIYKNQPGELDDFARCLDTAGATFYGAYWCPHCADQKAMFGNSVRLLPYVECALPGGGASGGMTLACQKANITSYPTWEFADGSRQTGVIAVEKLSELTGCQLP